MRAGLAALFTEAPAAFTALRLGGAAYLAYLGVRAWRSARRGSPLDPGPAAAVSGRYAYLRGAVTNLVNPKSVTFVVALLPQFVDRGLGHVPLQFAALGAIFVGFEVLIDGTVGLTAGRLGGWLARRRRARQALDAGPARSCWAWPDGWRSSAETPLRRSCPSGSGGPC